MTAPALPPDLLQYRLAGPDGVEHTFNGDPDSNGVFWIMKSLDGWESPDIRPDTAERVGDHGLFTGTFLYGGRPLTAAGYLYSPSGIAALRQARDTLLAAVDTPGSMCTVKVDETPPRQVLAKRNGHVGIAMRGKTLLEFDIPLLAPDPRRYAQTAIVVNPITTGTGTAVTPGGNFRDGTPATITITPASGSGAVTESTTGLSFSITGTRTVVFDSLAKTVTYQDDGSLAFDAVNPVSEFWILMRPGVTYRFKRVGGSAASVTYQDAWV